MCARFVLRGLQPGAWRRGVRLGWLDRDASLPVACIGAIAGIATTILVRKYTVVHWTLYTPVAILSCVVIGLLASLLLPPPKQDLTGLTVFTVLPQSGQQGNLSGNR